MRRSLIRVLMHFRGLLWRKGPKRIPRAGGDSSTSSKVRICEKTLGRGNQIVHQWTRGAKTADEGSGARLALNSGARHGVGTIASRAAAGHRRSRLALPEGKMRNIHSGAHAPFRSGRGHCQQDKVQPRPSTARAAT